MSSDVNECKSLPPMEMSQYTRGRRAPHAAPRRRAHVSCFSFSARTRLRAAAAIASEWMIIPEVHGVVAQVECESKI